MSQQSLKHIEERFIQHLQSVDELIGFDNFILEVCVNHLEDLNSKFKNGGLKITNQMYLTDGTIKAIKNIRSNNSLRPHYESMYNSCLVLQVSYFTSAIDDIFKRACYFLYINENRIDLNREELKKNDINFQNMVSTTRTFKKYLGIEIKKSTILNVVTLAQHSRHTIVHALGIADQKFIEQINTATPRTIKKSIDLNDVIQFSPGELSIIKLAMKEFISSIIKDIQQKHKVV